MTLSHCKKTEPCFARNNCRCFILISAMDYKNKPCPFMKPDREVTDGKVYPYNPYYGYRG